MSPAKASRTAARPFLKWAGGKRQLLEQLAPHFPRSLRGRIYLEPFLGGGAVFFHLRPPSAVLSDSNSELIDCYRAVQTRVEEVIDRLGDYRNEEAFYYEVRARDPRSLELPDRAARTIFLNRTGFNGLYRLNRSGRFNVPFGRYARPRLCDAANLRAVARSLEGVRLAMRPFTAVLEDAGKGDFVYFDPPYHPLSTTSSFTAYTSDSFGEDEQRELARVFRELASRGCRVMLSNSDTPFIRSLYADFRLETVRATRAINSRPEGRGRIDELLVLAP